MKIEDGKVVDIEYTIRLSSGDVADATDGDPMPYLHGADEVVPGLEKALVGRQAGEKLQVTLEPEDAYGDPSDDLSDVVARDMFPKDVDLEVGDEVTLIDDDGEEVVGYVAAFTGDEVEIDFNHPLAGETITIDVEIVAVRDATAEELKQGQANDTFGQH